ncbi:hypothetical protein RclHR1_09740006 [Rhizophagus clarus]|uniref:Uncharacterized protein n=1 Tax=Rhizophagus clarus TaxID=94130 RepID=A0A2Z6S7G2_9GLOM|nr:hypothetical protein RclHR1_09740006 [Rhizophagus clarus]
MGWDNKNIIDVLLSNINFCPFSCKVDEYEIFIYELGSSIRSDWNKVGNGYKSSIIHTYKKRAAIFISEIDDNKCYVYIYQDFKIQKIFVGTTPDDVWKNSGFIQKFSGKELFGLKDQITLQKLNNLRILQCVFREWELNSELKLLYPPEYQFSDRELSAWLSLLCAAGCSDITPWSHGKSKVGFYTIIKSRRHTVLNGFGILPIKKPKFHRLKFKIEQIDQFDHFFMRKDVVNMSSYRTHSKSGLPIMYLQDHNRFVYQDDLNGLCSECNECGYEIFTSINTIIAAHVDEFLKKELIKKLNILRKYMKHEYIKDLKITSSGTLVNLDELNEDGAVIIVDYKIRILPQNTRKIKSQFFGKRGWTLHSSLVYTKDITNNKLDIQISQAIKRYVKPDGTIESSDHIEIAIHDIAGTKVANLLPNRNQDISIIKEIIDIIFIARIMFIFCIEKEKVGTIARIKSLHEWTWPQKKNEKPNPEYSTHTKSSKKWTLPIVVSKVLVDNNNHNVFVSKWALKPNKNYKQELWKRISKSAKHLLENMFHTGTANPNNKFTAQQIYEELMRRVQFGELDEMTYLKSLLFRIGLLVSPRNGKKSWQYVN